MRWSEMTCFPFIITAAAFIESLDHHRTRVLSAASCHYLRLQPLNGCTRGLQVNSQFHLSSIPSLSANWFQLLIRPLLYSEIETKKNQNLIYWYCMRPSNVHISSRFTENTKYEHNAHRQIRYIQFSRPLILCSSTILFIAIFRANFGREYDGVFILHSVFFFSLPIYIFFSTFPNINHMIFTIWLCLAPPSKRAAQLV